MGSVDYSVQRRRLTLLLLAGGLALLTSLLFTLATPGATVTAQISPLSPMTVATPLPQSQPEVIPTGVPSPLESPQTDNSQPSTSVQNPVENRDFNQSPLTTLGEPSQAQVSLILVGALLVGLGLLVIVVLFVRRRE